MISYQFIKDKKIWTVTSTGEDSLGVTCETGETASMTSDEILRLPTTMLTLPEFKNRYGEQIADYNMTEAEISACYNTYCEDPEVFNKYFIVFYFRTKVISQGAPYIERDMENTVLRSHSSQPCV